MADLKLGNIKPVGADNIVVDGKYVKGGYVVVSSTTERDALKGSSGENIVTGSLCYCTADSKFYQYNGTSWVESSIMNQNAFSNVKVGDATVAADSITDTIEFTGSNITITPDTTNDKVTFSVADGTTLAKGIVRLSSTTGSSENVAATPKGVKAAIDQTNYAGSTTPGGAANSVKASVTFNDSGNGATSGTTFDGSAAKIISYNTIGAAEAGHTHTTTIAASSGTNELTLAHGTKYAITAGGDSFVFTMPSGSSNSAHSHSAGTGLIKTGTGTTSGTITYSANLKSTTALTSGTVPVGVDSSGYLVADMSSYSGCEGKVKIGSTWYSLRKGTSGAAGFITFNY